MLWLAIRAALAAYLLTRRRFRWLAKLVASILLPRPLRSLAGLLIAARVAVEYARERRSSDDRPPRHRR